MSDTCVQAQAEAALGGGQRARRAASGQAPVCAAAVRPAGSRAAAVRGHRPALARALARRRRRPGTHPAGYAPELMLQDKSILRPGTINIMSQRQDLLFGYSWGPPAPACAAARPALVWTHNARNSLQLRQVCCAPVPTEGTSRGTLHCSVSERAQPLSHRRGGGARGRAEQRGGRGGAGVGGGARQRHAARALALGRLPGACASLGRQSLV